MAGQVEHITDLGLVNYVQHPTNPKYIVFRFAHEDRANAFEKALIENDIWFEKDQQQGKTRIFYLFAIHRKNYSKVQKINFQVEAENRSFLIKNNIFRYLFMGITIGIIVLAFVGYCKRPDMVQKKYYEQQYYDSVKQLNN
jgi:hypothetical protein